MDQGSLAPKSVHITPTHALTLLPELRENTLARTRKESSIEPGPRPSLGLRKQNNLNLVLYECLVCVRHNIQCFSYIRHVKFILLR